MKFDRGPPTDGEIAQGLASLKREGGLVLVLGAASDAQRRVCQRFLDGDDDRVFVDTDSTVRDDRTDATERIERPFSTRGSAAAGSSPPVPGFGSLAADLESAMRDAADGTETLRVCFDSLRPFVDTTDTPTLVSSLESIRGTARDTGAVIHVHLPATRRATPTTLLETADAVVEVRGRGGETYQRWQFPDEVGPTEWVEV